MDEQQDKEVKTPKTNGPTSNGSILGFAIILFVIIILNSLVFPRMFENKIVDVDYGTFIDKIENGMIKKVSIEGNSIYFIALDVDNQEVTYQTGNIDDPDLVERLLSASSPNENNKVQFSKAIPRENSPIINFLLMWVLPILLFVVMWRAISKFIQGKIGEGGNAMTFGKSDAKIYAESEIKTTFADVAGQDEAKEALSEVVDFLHNPEKYAEIGASLPKGVLLVGPPGTGKTLVARAVAGEAKVPFFAISGSEFVQMFVGMGAAKVRDLFKQASEKAPCIVFIDEIDTIGKKRDNAFGTGGNDEREQTLNQLLTEMDGFDGKKGVVLLAATNRPESLDKALLRPGRFDRRITMELPDLEGRKSILEVHLKKVKHSNINIDLIARATAGSSGAELANIVNEAALRAVRMGRNQLETSDLEESVEVVIAGAQKKGKIVSDKEKRIIAYHEIGHALVAAKQNNSAPVHKITIIPRTSGALGYTMQIDSGEQNLMNKEELLNRIATLTGGRAAEEIIFNSITTGASNDIEQATKLARAMVTRFGMSEQYGMMALETVNNPYLGADTTLTCSPDTSANVDQEVLKIIKDAYKKSSLIINENIEKMHELSKYLLEKETITGEEFMEILNK